MSLICILGYVALIYLFLCLILTTVTINTSRVKLKLTKLRLIRFFLSQPILWLEEFFNKKA